MTILIIDINYGINQYQDADGRIHPSHNPRADTISLKVIPQGTDDLEQWTETMKQLNEWFSMDGRRWLLTNIGRRLDSYKNKKFEEIPATAFVFTFRPGSDHHD